MYQPQKILAERVIIASADESSDGFGKTVARK
jgi:hypothetical protein